MQALTFDIAARDKTQAVFARIQRNAQTTMAGINKGLGLLGFANGVLGVVSSLDQMVDRSIAFGKTLDDVSKASGLTTDELQRLRFAGLEAGGSTAGMDAALVGLTQRLGSAAQGQGHLAEVMRQYGIDVFDAGGQIRPTIDVVSDLAEVIESQGSEAEQNRIGTAAFGFAWQDIVPALRDGASGLEAAGDRAQAMGGILESDVIENLAETKKRTDLLNESLKANEARGAESLAQLRLWGQGLQIEITDRLSKAVEGLLEFNNEVVKSSGFDPGKLLNAIGEYALAPWSLVTDGITAANDAYATLVGDMTSGDLERALQSIKESAAALKTELGGGGMMAGESAAYYMLSADVPGRSNVPAKPSNGGRGGGGRGGGGRSDEVQDLIKALEHEQAQLSRTSREQEIFNNLQRAGEHATAGQKAQIEALAGTLYDTELAQKALNERTEYFGNLATDALTDIIVRGGEVEDVLKRISEALAEAVIQAALLGQGPFASMMGTQSQTAGGTGGLFGALFGGFKAKGGPLDPGKWYIAGEQGPEPIWGGGAGAFAVPSGAAMGRSGGGASVNINIINRVDADVKAQARTNDNGDIDIELLIDQAVAKKVAQPGAASNRQLAAMGVRQPGIRR